MSDQEVGSGPKTKGSPLHQITKTKRDTITALPLVREALANATDAWLEMSRNKLVLHIKGDMAAVIGCAEPAKGDEG